MWAIIVPRLQREVSRRGSGELGVMTKGLILGVSLTAVTLALSPWLTDASDERQPAPHDSRAPPPASRSATASTVVWLAGQTGPVTQEAPRNDSLCLTCHSDPSLQTWFADGRILSLQVDPRGLRDSAHGLLTCVTCHDDRHVYPPDRAEPLDFAAYQAEGTEMCIGCHLAAAGDYAESAHGQPVLTGSGDGATCNDCHSPVQSGHTVGWLSDPSLQLAPQSVDENCGRCHEQELKTYRHTSHSKVARFGDPERPANCTTCHDDHAVKAVDDPNEPLTAANLVTVCSRCHRGADEAFVSGWLGHEASSSQSPGLYYGERFIVLLIAASLGSGVAHISLDFRRRLTDRWRNGGARPGESR